MPHCMIAVVLPGGLDHLAAFPDVVRNRLLDIDVLARLGGQRRRSSACVWFGVAIDTASMSFRSSSLRKSV